MEEELLGRFLPCSEWFVLRSSSLFLVGGVDQILGGVEQMFSCSEWFVLRSSSLFLVGGVEQMWEPCISERSSSADGGATGQFFSLF